MFFEELETERLRLKNISPEDRDFILTQFSDESVTRYLYDAEPLTNLDDTDEIIDFYIQPEPRCQHRWVVVQKCDGKKIGTCGFHYWKPAEKCVDIGYDLRKEYQGKGFMSEALAAIIYFAEKQMKVNQIDAHIYIENEKSIALAKRLHFTFDGETLSYSYKSEQYLHHIYSLNMPLV